MLILGSKRMCKITSSLGRHLKAYIFALFNEKDKPGPTSERNFGLYKPDGTNKKTGSSIQEEVDTSCHDAVADNAFEEEEGETNTYYLPGVHEGSKSTQPTQKRRKNYQFYGGRAYEMAGDLTFGSQPSVLSGKRSGSNLNVAIPTKRVRTASRPRTISPFNAGTSGSIQAPNRTDASSGDTNSYQDEQSTLHGGSQIPNNNMEAESVGDYEKQLQFDSMEVSNRPKKKKKTKYPGSTFEHRWQLDSNFQNGQVLVDMIRLPDWVFESAAQEMRVMEQDATPHHQGLLI